MGGQTKLHLPRGVNGEIIQVYEIDDTTVIKGTIGASADRQSVPSGAEVLELSLEADVFVAFGDITVTADSNSRILFRGMHLYTMNIETQTHVSVLQLTGSDTGSWTMAKLA